MFTPDREPHPAVAEIRYLMQPVSFEPTDTCGGTDSVRIRVTASNYVSAPTFSVCNRYVFLSLDHLSWSWSLTSNRHSEPIGHGTFDVKNIYRKKVASVSLESTIDEVLSLERTRPFKGNSYFLCLRGHLKEDSSWAKAGHLVVEQQFSINFLFANPIGRSATEQDISLPISWRMYDDMIHIENKIGECAQKLLVLDPETGGIATLFGPTDGDVLAEQIVPNFVRPATDNDKGGLEQTIRWLSPLMDLCYFFGFTLRAFSYFSRWKKVGLCASTPPVMECIDLRIHHVADQVRADALCHVRSKVDGTVLLKVQIYYNVWGDGRLKVTYHVQPTSVLKQLTSLPRVGVSMFVNALYYRISYFGRGPGENYPDRKASSLLGLFHTTPQGMGYMNYIVPTETGSRSDCEWIAMRNEETFAGLLITPPTTDDECVSFGALHYSAPELELARHTFELPYRGDGEDMIHLNIDHRMMGLGGDISWLPAVYPEYCVKPDVSYRFGLWFIPLSKEQDDPATLSRDIYPRNITETIFFDNFGARRQRLEAAIARDCTISLREYGTQLG
eukprot:scaffold2989_cov184-Amphora_coffeaeformis.AAC.5